MTTNSFGIVSEGKNKRAQEQFWFRKESSAAEVKDSIGQERNFVGSDRVCCNSVKEKYVFTIITIRNALAGILSR